MDPRAFPLSAARDEAVHRSVEKAKAFLLGQGRTRSPHRASRIVPDRATVDRLSNGLWGGTFSLPHAADSPPYTPVLIKGPLHFPIAARRSVMFHGSIDFPFVSMEGAGAAWPDYFVVGSVDGITQFVAKVRSNGTFEASLVSPPAGQWSFQL